MTVDSTGVPFVNYAKKALRDATGPQTYTLTTGEEKIDLSQKNLGSADINLVATWLQRPEVSATLTKIDICGARIDEGVFATLKGVAPEGCEVLWEYR
jgi:hypothetical protein